MISERKIAQIPLFLRLDLSIVGEVSDLHSAQTCCFGPMELLDPT